MNPCIWAIFSIEWKTIWVVLSNGGKIGMNAWLHTSLLVHREFLMFSDIACMHFNALFSAKTTKKVYIILECVKSGIGSSMVIRFCIITSHYL
jgi:hypothetical protein